MSNQEKAALALERKILRAIERGEFTPASGYLSDHGYRGDTWTRIEIGPCGCAIAAAASVNGLGSPGSGPDELVAYLKTVGLSTRDSHALENGYEENALSSTNPYFHVGQRLRRFHPRHDGRVEV
jgi:hypothetical protein